MDYEGRFQYFIGMILALIINFAFTLILNQIWESFTLTAFQDNVIFYIFYGLITLGAIFISCFVINFLLKRLNPTSLQTYTINEFVEPFSFDHFGSQILTGIVLICIFYIPLDFLSSIIPGVLEYEANSLLRNHLGQYFTFSFPLMLVASTIIQFFVALREETFFRSFAISFGSKTIKKNTAYFYSVATFGLAHFSYIFAMENQNFSAFFPIFWGINATLIGIVSGVVFLRKKRIWPLIIAHWGNNILSSIVLRNYLDDKPLSTTFLTIYLPIFVLGILILVFQRHKVKDFLIEILNRFKGYIQENQVIPDQNLPNPEKMNQNISKKSRSSVAKAKNKLKEQNSQTNPDLKKHGNFKEKLQDSQDFSRSKIKIDPVITIKFILIDSFLIILLWLFELIMF